MDALYRGDLEEAQRLVPPDDELSTAEAAAFGRIDRLRALLDEDSRAANDWTPDGFGALAMAIYGGHEDAVRLLIERGADLEALSRHETIRVRPLQTAAFVRSVPMARLLLDAGADVNSRAEGGFTALHTAADNGDAELARLLLERGADPGLTTDEGKQPVDYATGPVAALL
jgi:ankyrin repeat protein